jgi:hypothetical protein
MSESSGPVNARCVPVLYGPRLCRSFQDTCGELENTFPTCPEALLRRIVSNELIKRNNWLCKCLNSGNHLFHADNTVDLANENWCVFQYSQQQQSYLSRNS